jgi:hypothetical protein
VRALELRKAGAPYRQIATELGVDVHTAHADVGAELAALRETAVGEAAGLPRRDDPGGCWSRSARASAPAGNQRTTVATFAVPRSLAAGSVVNTPTVTASGIG